MVLIAFCMSVANYFRLILSHLYFQRRIERQIAAKRQMCMQKITLLEHSILYIAAVETNKWRSHSHKLTSNKDAKNVPENCVENWMQLCTWCWNVSLRFCVYTVYTQRQAKINWNNIRSTKKPLSVKFTVARFNSYAKRPKKETCKPRKRTTRTQFEPRMQLLRANAIFDEKYSVRPARSCIL